MSAQELAVGRVPCLALRVTYVGELGWELYCPAEFGLALWDTIWDAGRAHGLVAGGYKAIDSLRLEKGYRVWGADITPEDTPFEAGLGFAVKLDKGDFIGREALPRRRAGAPAPLPDARGSAGGRARLGAGAGRATSSSAGSRAAATATRSSSRSRTRISPPSTTSAPRSRSRSSASGSRARSPPSRCSTRAASGSAREQLRRRGRARVARRDASSRCSAAGSRTTTSRSRSTESATSSASPARTPNLLGIDRGSSSRRPRRGALGIGPEVVAFVEPEGWLVTRFIEGEMPPIERMREPEMLARRGALRASTTARRSRPFDSFRVVETYRGQALERGGGCPRRTSGRTDREADRGEARRPTAPVPCHNDLLNANFLDDGERLRIVDWEYAGMGDRFFDLANFSINHELDADESLALLSRTSAMCAKADVEGARADALHVRLPRGDVGGRADGRLRARLRLRRVRERALRATPPDGGVAVVRRCPRGLKRRGAPPGAPRNQE